jgi:hypothetical protein
VRKAKAAAVRTLDAPGRALVLGRSSPAGVAPRAAGVVPSRLLATLAPGAAVADRIRGALQRWLEEEM